MTDISLYNILRDLDAVATVYHGEYMPYILQQILPPSGSVEYYRVLATIKFLETAQKFNREQLALFTFVTEDKA